MSWPDEVHYLRPPQPLVVSLLLSTLVFFSDWRHTVLSKFFDTQVPSVFTEELVLPRHARYVLSRLRCNGHSLLLSSYLTSGLAELKILPAAPADTSYLILHFPATNSLATLGLYHLWFRPWGVSRLLGLHVLPPCPHPP